MAGHGKSAGRQVNSSPPTDDTVDDETDVGASTALTDLVAEVPNSVEGGDEVPTTLSSRHPVRLASCAALAAVILLGGLVGWFCYQAYENDRSQQAKLQFVQVARQAALDLTTIDYKEVDADVSRILGSATGSFHDDFQQRSRPFIEVVKQAKSASVGTVTEAGLESIDGDRAQVLVAVTVKTTTPGNPPQDPRGWRMRIGVQWDGGAIKVANVAFVP